MAFNDNAQLDPSQVEDRRGGRRMAGGTLAAGGGGLGLLVLVVSLLLGVNPFGNETQPSPTQQPEVAGAQSAPSSSAT